MPPCTIDFRRELNEEQLAVATAPAGPMLVVAGAGSGKTRALTYRVAWLVQAGVDTGRILLATFTNRAAREMLSRVERLTGCDVHRLWGGTFHHLASRLLRQHGECIGVPRDFSILDRDDARSLVGASIADLGYNKRERRFPQKAVVQAAGSLAQNTRQPLGEVLRAQFLELVHFEEQIAEVLALYQRKKSAQRVLDFDDLLTRLLDMLREQDAVREQLSERFEHLLVDEFQDTNAVQGAIVDLLAGRHRNLCVVGDDSQSIYRFRGATFDNIIGFQGRYPDARVFKLETNYRSTPEILAVANASIACNRRRLPKELRAVRPPGLRPALVHCRDQHQQARFIADYAERLRREGCRLSDMAVLYRSHYHCLQIQLELQTRSLPFDIRGGLRFFEQAHIKDVMAYLRVIHNPRDETAWTRLLLHLQGVGARSAQRFWEAIAARPDPLAAACADTAAKALPKRARDRHHQLAALLQELSRLAAPATMMEAVMAAGLDDYLALEYENAGQRREDIRGVIEFARQYADLGSFLSDIALTGENEEEASASDRPAPDRLTLSTVHQAKGLEWPLVFIPWLTEGRFPTMNAFDSADDLEEERRVFHVAVTRAKDELYLLVPEWIPDRYGGAEPSCVSLFLAELDEALTEPVSLHRSPRRQSEPAAPRGRTTGRAGTPPDDESPHPDDMRYDYGDDDCVPF